MKDWKVWALAAIGVAAVTLGLLALTQPDTHEPTVKPSPIETGVVEPTPLAPLVPSPTASPAKQAEKKWHLVRTSEGARTRNTEPFVLKSTKQRIVTVVKGKPSWGALFAVAVQPKAATNDFTMIGPVGAGQLGKSEYIQYLSPGEYYMYVIAANCKWTIRVWEWR